MVLIDISELEFEPFMMENGETVDYISAENLWKAPKVDPVNHAEWVQKNTRHTDGDVCVVHNCSHCGEMGAIKIFNYDEWVAYHKDHYVPKVSKYCGECGYKMDLRELYEQYKRDWCTARGLILEDANELTSINGEIYACFDEWYQNEYMEGRR